MAKANTITLSPTDLRYLLIDSLKEYSEDVAFISGTNPYKFSINKKTYFIFIHNTHSTGHGRPNADECRIQINKSVAFNAAKASGLPVFFFGYSAEERVFTAWNPFSLTERINQRKVVSVYSRFSVMRKAAVDGVAVYVDKKEGTAISFKPEYLGLYLENHTSMHVATEENLRELIDGSDKAEASSAGDGKALEIGGEKYVVTHRRFARDARFRIKVLGHYEDRCAACNIQLELVEAAHIIPFSHDLGTDDPQNGICLCVLHHRAYDSALIYFDSEFRWHLNKEKVEYLEKIHRDGGMTKFRDGINERVAVPASAAHRPSKDNIQKANTIRGIAS